jgi:hypothetical protein
VKSQWSFVVLYSVISKIVARRKVTCCYSLNSEIPYVCALIACEASSCCLHKEEIAEKEVLTNLLLVQSTGLH